MGRLARLARIFKDKVQEVRAEQKGVGRSKARLIKNAVDIDKLSVTKDIKVDDKTVTIRRLKARAPGAPKATSVGVHMSDQAPMVFFNDGSLRHALGHKPGKAARKALKRHRMAQRRRVHA